jgi:hypothetical protein
MKFLPDSAIVGTLSRIKHAGKPRPKKRMARLVDTRTEFVGGGDARSFEQLLAEAKRHAGR